MGDVFSACQKETGVDPPSKPAAMRTGSNGTARTATSEDNNNNTTTPNNRKRARRQDSEELPGDEGGSMRQSFLTGTWTSFRQSKNKGDGIRASTYDQVHQRAAYNIQKNKDRRKQGQPLGVCGLQNMGNTCFMNSSLQCLSATIPLTDYFLGYDYKREINHDNPLGTGHGQLATAYANMLSNLWSGKSLSIKPSKFKKQLGEFAPQFQGYQQHDAQELLAFMLDGIHEDLNRVKQKPYIEDKDCTGENDEQDAMEAWKNYLLRNKSIVVDIFQGQLKSRLTCLVCGHINVRFEPFMYLSLPIGPKCRSVPDCMKLFLAPEILKGENQWYCSRCKTHVNAEKKMDLWIVPPILIVHLKRFRLDDNYGKVGRKNNASLPYPMVQWDLRPFVKSRSSQEQGAQCYDLYAVSNHHGGLGSGHYTAYAQSRFGGQEDNAASWYEFNDSQTTPISPQTLQANSASAYLLFYNRTVSNTGTTAPAKAAQAQAPIPNGPPRPIPLVRRQSTNRPDLWPHTQVQDMGQVRSFARSSVRVSMVTGGSSTTTTTGAGSQATLPRLEENEGESNEASAIEMELETSDTLPKNQRRRKAPPPPRDFLS